MADEDPNPKHRCMLVRAYRNIGANPASLICKDDQQRIFLALKFPSSINGCGGPDTRVVRWMMTAGSACNDCW